MSDDAIRLLIVEDNPADARLVLEMLKEGSKTVRFDVAMADSIVSALEHLRGLNCDAILLDLGLPDSQGLDTLHSVHSEHPEIPIIVLTVLDDEENAVKALGGGAQDYIIKGRTEIAILARSIRYAIERKHAADALSGSGKKYRDLVETMNDVVFTLDFDGGVVDASPSMKRIIGLSREEVIGKSFSDFVHPDDIQRAEEEFLRAIQGIGRPLEIRVTTLDGTLRWIRINALLIMKDGEPDNLMCTLSDITERKKDEMLLAVQSDILTILTRSSNNPKETVEGIVGVLKLATGFDAVGIRLRVGDDYPFVASLGYSDEFLLAENTLTMKYPEGGLCRDKDGNVSLECTCGLLISGKADPANPMFTPGGSAWTNDSLPFLDVPPEQDPRLHPRNRCIHVGFRSLALVPLRAGDKIIGLMHLASRRTDCFTEKSIKFFEGIGVSIGVAVLRKQTEELLRESEKKYRLVVDSAAEAIMVGQDGMIRLANPMATTMTGFSEQELMSKPFPLFVHQDDRVMLLGHHERRLRGEAVPARYVFRMIAKDGSTKWLEMSGVSIEWEGRPATLNFMTDVTERKKAETELYGSLLDLTKARDSLELSEEKFRALANTTTDWVYWIGPKGDFVFNSPSALKISGHRPEEFLSDPDLLIHVIHPDDRDRFQKHLTECTSTSTMAEPCEIEFRILMKDGDVRWISHTCGPIVDKNNQPLGRRASNRDITNRKRAEEELASALTRLKEAHHLAHIGAWDWLIENDTVIWSEELYRIAGMDPSLPAPTYAEHPLHYTPTSWEKLDCAVKSALTTGEPYNLELELVRPDGSIRRTNAIGGVKRDERGKVIGLHGILQDITERKRSEDALSESEKKYRQLVEIAQEGIWTIDANANTTYANPRMAEILGYMPEEMMGRHLFSFMDERGKEIAQIELDHRKQGIKEQHDFEFLRKDGQRIYTSLETSPIMDEAGNYIGALAVVADITARKRAEHQANERLKELGAFYYLAKIVEREGVTLEKLYQEFVNFLPESWRYPEIACARIVLGGEEFRTENYMDSAWKQSAPIKVNKAARGTVEICYLEERPEADEGPFLKEERQLIDAIAERLGHIIDLKLAELELTNETIVATESRQKAEAYFDFLAHDIANILSPMVAYADMLKARPNDPEQVIKFSSKILEQGKRASSLISNLRRLESIERTHPNEIDTIDLRTLFSSLEDEIQSGFPDKEVALSYDIPDVQSMTVKGGEWVENVLRCVYDNAVRYSTGSAVELEIRASMLQEEGGEPFWQIEVSDHGPGIPDNVKNHFGESLTVVSDREFKGVASSLPFCVSMIKCLGGELLVQDRIPGDHKQGTRITIRLPKGE